MIVKTQNKITSTLENLFEDSKYDKFKMMKSVPKFLFRPIQPSDFKEVYLSISKEQGEDLVALIKRNNIKNMVEFGTSFGISTLYLAQGAIETDGSIVTTELLPSKAKKATENFKKAGVNDLIDLRIGDALETLRDYNEPIDLLLLDGWKNLYLPLFEMLEFNFHKNTVVYVHNADMGETKDFLRAVAKKDCYQFESKHNGKVVLISLPK